MLLSLLTKEDKSYFLDLLRQLLLIDGEQNEIEKQIYKKFKFEMGEDILKHRTNNAKTPQLIAYFEDKSHSTKNIVFMNLISASLRDEWYNVETHTFIDEVQKAFKISDKKRIELMKVVYAERDLREKAKRTINEE